jgi:hypothetical protein
MWEIHRIQVYIITSTHNKPVFSARVGISFRVLGIQQNDEMIWFWIGSHSDYH